MKIILIGFMGSGKSTVAKLLAAKLQMPCIESDEEIIKKSGKSSVAEIFDQLGENAFRSMENQVAQEYGDQDSIIVSTGGGMIISDPNYQALKANSEIIYLKTDFDTIKERIEKQIKESGNDRPLFKDIEEAHSRYHQRAPIYEARATRTITTDNKTPSQVAAEIIKTLIA